MFKLTKRYHILLIAVCLVGGLCFLIKPAQAATHAVTGGTNGPLCNSGGYFTPPAITITDGDTITFSVPSNDPYAGGIQINGLPQGSITVARGASVATNALHSSFSYQGTWPNAPSCIKGSGTVTVQAPASPPPASPPPASPSPPPPSSSPPAASSHTSKTTAPASPSPTPSPAASASSATVVADTITVNGSKVTSIENLSIKQSEPLVLAGHTVPNGQVTFTIHSAPKTATAKADASGNWTYTISGLEPGNHTVDATVTDPSTNQTSATAKLLAFTVTANAPVVANAAISASNSAKKSNSMLIELLALAVIIIGAVAFWFIKKRKKNPPAHPQNPATPTVQPTQIPEPPAPPNNPPV
jgi:hypothetical protein